MKAYFLTAVIAMAFIVVICFSKPTTTSVSSYTLKEFLIESHASQESCDFECYCVGTENDCVRKGKTYSGDLKDPCQNCPTCEEDPDCEEEDPPIVT